MRTTRRLFVLAGAVPLGLTTALLGVAPASAADNARVSVLHAVPGATVDVYVDGKALLTDFEPGTLTDPQSLPAGSYDLKVVKAGDGESGDAIVEAKDVEVPGGANITVVAHLDEDGDPALTPFVNDTDSLEAGEARVTARHTAAAPEVDVRAGGEPVFSDLNNPDEDSAVVDAGSIEADVVLAGTDDVAIGPATLNLKEGTSTIVYAWGSAEDDNLEFAVQVISGLHGNPNGVPAGDGGPAAAVTPLALTMMGLAGIGVAISARRLQKSKVHAAS